MKTVPVLKTARLTMRGIAEEDTNAIVVMRSNPDVYRFFVSPHQITEEEHLNWYRNSYLFNKNRIDWIAFDTTNNLIGVFGVKRENENSLEAEISYILAPEQYGKGFAAEAINRLMQFCKEEWNCTSVIAEIHNDNMDSIRFAERLGFVEEKPKFIIFRKEI
jgi:ribosomal-protein-alanine N-acetyltransferase